MQNTSGVKKDDPYSNGRAQRRRRSVTIRRPARYLHFVLGTVVVAAPLALGGAIPTTSLAICLGVLLSAILVSTTSQKRHDARLSGIAVAAFAIPWGATLLQLVPLGCSLLPEDSIARTSIEELRAWGFEGASCTISLAPGTTRLRLIEWTAVFTAFVLAHWLTRTRGPQILHRAVIASSATMALVALGHWVANTELVFGVYSPLHDTPFVLLAPLLNGNHFAGLMVLGLPPCVASMLAATQGRTRLLWGTCALLLFVCLLLSLSRAGIAAGFASVVPVFFWAYGGRPQGKNTVAMVSLGCLLAAIGFLTAGWLSENLHLANLDKIEHIVAASAWVLERPWTGVGRGALAVAHGLRGAWDHRLTHVENLPIQWAVDWGVPVAVAALLCFGGIFRRIALPDRFFDRAMWVALLALCAQNLLDFSLELPGVGVVAAVSLGTLTATRAPSQSGVSCRRAALGLTVLGAVQLAGVGGSAIVYADAYTLNRRLEAVESEGSPDRLLDAARRAAAAQPHEAIAALWVARAHAPKDLGLALKWLNRAMRLAPKWAGPHLVAAELLAKQGLAPQGILELREAATRAPHQAGHLACELARYDFDHELLLRALPAESPWEFAEPLTLCLQSSEPSLAERLGTQVLLLRPRVLDASIRVAQYQLERGAPEQALHTLAWAPDHEPRVAERRCRAHMDLGDYGKAIETTEESSAFKPLSCRAWAVAKAGDRRRLKRSLERLDRSAGRNDRLRTSALATKATLYYEVGDHVASVAAAREAYQLSGEVRWLKHAHTVAVEAGLYGTALVTKRELCRATKNESAACMKQPTRR